MVLTFGRTLKGNVCEVWGSRHRRYNGRIYEDEAERSVEEYQDKFEDMKIRMESVMPQLEKDLWIY